MPIAPRSLLFSFATLLVTVVPLHAATTAVVTTHDGSTFEGTLVRQSAKVVVLNIAGIDTQIEQTNVADIVIKKSPEDLYAEKRAELKDNDLDGRYALASEMVDLKALQIARTELSSLDRDFPGSEKVRSLLTSVEAQIKISNESSTERPRPDTNSVSNPRDRVPAERPAPVHPDRYLDASQINVIKVYEVDLADRPRITIPRQVLDEVFEDFREDDRVPRTSADKRAFLKRPGYEQLKLLFDIRARDYYDKVQVREEPAPLSEFRRVVNANYVARYFQPTFGAGQLPGLTLFSARPESENEAYSNFYLLNTFSYEGKPLIDRTNPEDSLLLQWALPRERAKYAAPEVEGWQPLFRTTDDPQFKRYADWIGSLYKFTPDYGIDYSPEPQASDEPGS